MISFYECPCFIELVNELGKKDKMRGLQASHFFYFFRNEFSKFNNARRGRVAQSVTCLATDACLTADPGVASSIPARYHTFVEIDHEIISTVVTCVLLIVREKIRKINKYRHFVKKRV